MNPEQITGTVRAFLAFFGGVATALGWTWFQPLSEMFLSTIAPVLNAVGPVMLLASAVWSLVKNKNANIVTAAAQVPGVAAIQLQHNEAGRALAPNSVTPPNVLLPGTGKLP